MKRTSIRMDKSHETDRPTLLNINTRLTKPGRRELMHGRSLPAERASAMA